MMPTSAFPKPRRDLGYLLLDKSAKTVPIWFVAAKDDAHLRDLTEVQRRLARSEGLGSRSAERRFCCCRMRAGASVAALLGVGDKDWRRARSPLLPGALPGALPPGDYRFASTLPDPELATLAWLAGSYRFGRYKSANDVKPKRLALPDGVDRDSVLGLAEGVFFGRDLINTPSNDLGPAELEAAAREIAIEHGASVKVTEGSSLLSDNFPMIHAVGRASDRAPRLIDLRWGSERAPKVTVVGKGICFDTGGLRYQARKRHGPDEEGHGWRCHRADLRSFVMQAKLPLRLRVLIPAAENSISGNAYRPGDVLKSRNGMSVEIGNTDAEGRLVLADALSLADEEAPDYLFTIATLTGAARVALGPDLPPLYTDDEDLRPDCSQVPAVSAILFGGCHCGRPTTSCLRATSPT